MGFIMPADLCRPDRRDNAVSVVANVISWVLDEALLTRVGNFRWSVGSDSMPPDAVPVNRYERAATHLWHVVFGQPGRTVPEQDAEQLFYLMSDVFKSASRCQAGTVRDLMNCSVWHDLMERLRAHLKEVGYELVPWQR